jgi:hypothetical protein
MCPSVSDFDRYSLTIARWLTHVQDAGNPAENYTTRGDVTTALTKLQAARESQIRSLIGEWLGCYPLLL